MLGGQRSHVIIERAEEGEPGDEASISLHKERMFLGEQNYATVQIQCNRNNTSPVLPNMYT